jgi:hypothetical protein
MVTRAKLSGLDDAMVVARGEQDAEDVCQNVFFRVFHNIRFFETRSSLKTWIMRNTHSYGTSLNSAFKRSPINSTFL